MYLKLYLYGVFFSLVINNEGNEGNIRSVKVGVEAWLTVEAVLGG